MIKVRETRKKIERVKKLMHFNELTTKQFQRLAKGN